MKKTKVVSTFKELGKTLESKTREKITDPGQQDILVEVQRQTLEQAVLALFPTGEKVKQKSCIIRNHPTTFVISVENMDIEVKHVHQMKFLEKVFRDLGYRVTSNIK